MIFKGSAISVQLLDAGIAELNFDLEGESVNKFNAATVAELGQALDALDTVEGLKGVLATSGKGVFIVGADITEFLPMLGNKVEITGDHLSGNNGNFNRIEDYAVPFVVAINGYALGGGLEFCLACDYRVMSTVAKIGLPETKLGLIPGWGGTVRLPRIAGADTAIDWIASAKDQRPDVALKAGVVDGVVAPENLRDAALKVLQNCIDGNMDYAQRRAVKKAPLQLNQTESMMVFETSKALVIVAAFCMQSIAVIGAG